MGKSDSGSVQNIIVAKLGESGFGSVQNNVVWEVDSGSAQNGVDAGLRGIGFRLKTNGGVRLVGKLVCAGSVCLASSFSFMESFSLGWDTHAIETGARAGQTFPPRQDDNL